MSGELVAVANMTCNYFSMRLCVDSASTEIRDYLVVFHDNGASWSVVWVRAGSLGGGMGYVVSKASSKIESVSGGQ
jgi:hypothetical protein